MSSEIAPATPSNNNTIPVVSRQWLAGIALTLRGGKKTALVKSEHYGPLRVQRPFYPENNSCCHIYLLHPPGGLVIGDKLNIKLNLTQRAHTLITTPSAGKIYGAKQAAQTQGQFVNARIESDAVLEWLPQETIVFNGANGELGSKVILEGNAKFFGWDIVRLGRVASQDYFTQGKCTQRFEIWRDAIPLHIEKVNIQAQCESYSANFGLQGANTTATLMATLQQSREQIDTILQALTDQKLDARGNWGITQKETLFIVRYLGDSITDCRKGFEYIWQKTRIDFNGAKAVAPRIWNT